MREAILDGRKSETRRIWKRPHVKVNGKLNGIYKVRKGRYTKEFYFKIKVLEVFKQRLNEMTEEDAYAEGFESDVDGDGIEINSALSKFVAYWREINGKWNPGQEVYVVKFELVEDVR